MTTIKALDNFTNESVKLRVVGGTQQEVHVRPYERGLFECIVPVCNDAADFSEHRLDLLVAIPAKTYSIWESDGRIRFSTDGAWTAEARPLPGESQAEGERALVVGGTGGCSLKRAK
jgi:hypothetical protein